MRTVSAMLVTLSIVAGLAAPASAECSSETWNNSGNYPVWKF
jgi:hypothetical protein